MCNFWGCLGVFWDRKCVFLGYVCFLVCLGVCLGVKSGCLNVFRCVFGCVCVLSVLFMLFFRFL